MAANDLFERLRAGGVEVTQEQQNKMEERLNKILNYEPRVGIFGKTGVGKSSLCNALFGKEICEISDVEACTRDTKDVLLSIGGSGIKLLDVPGVGESEQRDEEYAKLYSELLPNLDLVLWLVKADDRAMASDENFYKNIVKPHLDQGKPFFMVVNQVDKIEPFREWDEEKHEPGPKQFQNIDRKIAAIADQFGLAKSKVIAVSANEKYNLTRLVDEIVQALPAEHKVTMFKAVSEEFRSVSSGEHVKNAFLDLFGAIADVILGKGIGGLAKNIVGGLISKSGDFISGAGDFISGVVDFFTGWF